MAGLWPLAGRIATHVAPDAVDPVLNIYLASWVAERLGHGLEGLWSPPFFHPTRGVLAYSDHNLGPGVVTWLAGRLGIGAVAAYNLQLFGAFALTAFAVYLLLARGLALPRWAALLAGAAVAWAPHRWDQLTHLQVLRLQWAVAAVWALDRLLARPRAGRLAAFLGCYLAHLAGGAYLALLGHLPLALVAAARLCDFRRRLLRPRALLLLGAGAAVAVAAAAALYLPYREVARAQALARPLWEVRSHGATWWSFLQASPRSALAPLWPAGGLRPEQGLFPGLLLTGAALAGALAARGGRRPPGRAWPAWGALAAGYALSQLEASRGVAHRQRFGALWREELGDAPLGTLLVLAALAALAARALRRGGGGPAGATLRRALLVSGLLAFLLCHAVFFLPATALVPGLAGLRVPTRLAPFVLLALAVLGAAGLAAAARRIRARSARRALFAAAAALLLLEARGRPLPASEVVELPGRQAAPVVDWLAGAPEVAALAVLPLGEAWRETIAMHLQRYHGRPLANGHSGYLADSFRYFRWACDGGAPPVSPRCLAALGALGVSHLLVWDFDPAAPPPAGEEARLAPLLAPAARPAVRLAYRDAACVVLDLR